MRVKERERGRQKEENICSTVGVETADKGLSLRTAFVLLLQVNWTKELSKAGTINDYHTSFSISF